MNGDIDLRIDASFDEAQEIWQSALANGHLLRVRTPDGELKAGTRIRSCIWRPLSLRTLWRIGGRLRLRQLR
jgi:hypothetical protein